MQKHKKSAFTLLEILIVISITAIVISMGQNINFINLTSFNEKTIHERNKEIMKSMVLQMAIAPETPSKNIRLIACNNAEVIIGAGGIVKPIKLKCRWGNISIDKAGNIYRAKL